MVLIKCLTPKNVEGNTQRKFFDTSTRLTFVFHRVDERNKKPEIDNLGDHYGRAVLQKEANALRLWLDLSMSLSQLIKEESKEAGLLEGIRFLGSALTNKGVLRKARKNVCDIEFSISCLKLDSVVVLMNI
ncbi:hypothetical protein TNIN_412831 [Trichonephila inaurata madagascariensis]|uniref:Uncharacterized protein n=1 Tax=Trichonephila inaurata madagascariensis TaxID=2747483 RepID=A0A8X6X053_9ARAC|nr:hypothetical protein TNIN_412831 [Trichonephila inaurata madagascariensis]